MGPKTTHTPQGEGEDLSGSLNRRKFLTGGAALAGAAGLAGCATGPNGLTARLDQLQDDLDPAFLTMYGPMPEERFEVAGISPLRFPPTLWRREVADPTGEAPGTIVVRTGERRLYHVKPGGRAMRYACGIGREGFAWSGRARVGRKAVWPTWTPPAAMIERQPELEEYRHGMAPGPRNPLGARALYLYEGGRDTLYRLHGTSEVWSIGKAVSSGCVRLLQQDIVHLYNNTPVGTRVVVV